MTKADIEAALSAAFHQCATANSPLNEKQKRLLLKVAEELFGAESEMNSHQNPGGTNPLDELTVAERQALLKFVREKRSIKKMFLLFGFMQESMVENFNKRSP